MAKPAGVTLAVPAPMAGGALPESEIATYLRESRELVLREIRRIIPASERCRSILYDLMLEYPLRQAKALRPALCIATCRALGGSMEAVLPSAAALELYHNAFLIHDDVEDGSERRRNRPTLHQMHGVPIAVNVGDGMLALALDPLLDNVRLLGLGKALRILQVIARMARESAEGQAIELAWMRDRQWRLPDVDYLRMVYKKTSWYTFIAPMLIGGIIADAPTHRLASLRRFAASMGIGFQIQDDVLNLTADPTEYGKEIAGDLWEGKHTLIVLHMMRSVAAGERRRAERILAKPRPRTLDRPARPPTKTASEVRVLRRLIDDHASVGYAQGIAHQWSRRARGDLTRLSEWIPPSVHRDLLAGLADFVVSRTH